MIFISGVHGVGKTYFCNEVRERLGIDSFSASSLISSKKQKGFPANKLIPDIDINQQYLLAAIEDLRSAGNEFILDGHFCLLNGEGTITRIGFDTFLSLKPDAIILLTESPEIIAKRRKERDGVEPAVSAIAAFQDAERSYAKEVSARLAVPFFLSTGHQDLDAALEFIMSRRS